MKLNDPCNFCLIVSNYFSNFRRIFCSVCNFQSNIHFYVLYKTIHFKTIIRIEFRTIKFQIMFTLILFIHLHSFSSKQGGSFFKWLLAPIFLFQLPPFFFLLFSNFILKFTCFSNGSNLKNNKLYVIDYSNRWLIWNQT